MLPLSPRLGYCGVHLSSHSHANNHLELSHPHHTKMDCGTTGSIC
jgi:hypothetical protein